MDNKYVNKALELSSKVASNVYLDAISKGLMGDITYLDYWFNWMSFRGIPI